MTAYFLMILFSTLNLAVAAPPDSELAVIHQFEKELSAESCGQCHQNQYLQWKVSRHQPAYINSIFQKGYQHEPSQKCLECHLPTEEQRWALWNGVKPSLPEEGVTCISCHGRTHSGLQDVANEVTCAKCHQFS